MSGKPKQAKPKHTLTFEFPTEELMRQFASWLCNSGEQDFMNCMEDDYPDEWVNFDYHPLRDALLPKTDQNRYGEFVSDGKVRVALYKRGTVEVDT